VALRCLVPTRLALFGDRRVTVPEHRLQASSDPRRDWPHAPLRRDRGRAERPGRARSTAPYDPTIFARLDAIRNAKSPAGADDYVFTDSAGQPLSQEWLNKRVWQPTLRRCGLRARGQYNIRDTFITIALSAGEDPGWVAQVCGTSEQMIFRHYRRWMRNLVRTDGRQVATVFAKRSPQFGHQRRHQRRAVLRPRNHWEMRVEAGGIEPAGRRGRRTKK